MEQELRVFLGRAVVLVLSQGQGWWCITKFKLEGKF